MNQRRTLRPLHHLREDAQQNAAYAVPRHPEGNVARYAAVARMKCSWLPHYSRNSIQDRSSIRASRIT